MTKACWNEQWRAASEQVGEPPTAETSCACRERGCKRLVYPPRLCVCVCFAWVRLGEMDKVTR